MDYLYYGESFTDLLDQTFATPDTFDAQLTFDIGSQDVLSTPPEPKSEMAPSEPLISEGEEEEEEEVCALEEVQDVYCVGPQPAARWRTYINVENWDPETHHDGLLLQRAYHAKMVYELSLLYEMCETSWVSRETMEHLRLAALISLRSTEIHLASYQLMTGQIGFKRGRDALYHTAAIAHSVRMHLYDMFSKVAQLKGGRGAVMQERPSCTHTCKQLIRCIDTNLTMIHVMTKCGGNPFISQGADDAQQQGRRLVQMLTLLIHALDNVLYVLV